MSARRSSQVTVSFPAIDSANRPNRLSGITWNAGDTQVSKDGAAFVNTTNTPSEIGTTGRYALDLSAAEMDAKWVHVKVTDSTIDDVDIMVSTSGNPSGVVVADGSNSATSFKTDRTEATTDHWSFALITFTTGSLLGQVRKVDGYNGTTKFVTVTAALTGTPSNGDRFVLIEF